MYGLPIARQMEEWWKLHGQEENDSEWHAWLDRMLYYQTIKIEEWKSRHDNYDDDGVKLYGMSKAAGCTREANLNRLGEVAEPFDGADKFTFFIGHNVEIWTLATLDMIGQTITSTQSKLLIPGLMASASDGMTDYFGKPTIVSVKSAAYKNSSISKGKAMRRGFAELPVIGIAQAQPSWYAQAQTEMGASGIKQTIFVVGAKDVVKAYRDDAYLGQVSLSFYAELIPFDQSFFEMSQEVWEKQKTFLEREEGGPAMYFTKSGQYVELKKAIGKGSWGGDNQKITGTFNPCGGCRQFDNCKEVV